MSERVGVFLCDCGDRIARVLDLDLLAREVAAWPGVGQVRRLPWACSPDGLAAIQAAIASQSLSRVVVAGCTPRTLAPRFQRACEGAGLDRSAFDLVDVREGCAWVHGDRPAAATAKALDLIRMGLARLAVRRASAPAAAEVVPAALVVGGGPAGLTAALVLANAGVPVTLVERQAILGGLARAGWAPQATDSAGPDVAAVARRVAGHSYIQVKLESEVTQVSGTAGRYSVRIAHAGNGLRSDSVVEVGAMVVATGAEVLRPWGRYRYDGQRVLTQLEFARELLDRRATRPGGDGGGNGEGAGAPRRVVLILCAAQRERTLDYCSGHCCQAALRQALAVRSADPMAHVAILFRDLYLPGDDAQADLGRVRELGAELVRYPESMPPTVGDEQVEVFDELAGNLRRFPYDRVILATPLVPRRDAGVVARLFRLTQDEVGFFPQVRDRLRPENCAERGIYVCGAAHGPVGRGEAELQGASAAYSALRHLRSGRAGSRAAVAEVGEALCTGCGTCLLACPFGALSLQPRAGILGVARADPLLCKGCGSCVVACPVRAIDLPLAGQAEVLAQVEAALAAPPPDGEVRILAIGCEWSGHAAAELAGARGLSYPAEVRPICLPCSARFDPLHVLWALHCGADGVFLGGCPPGECHYRAGNRHAQERFEALRGLLAGNAFDARRVALEWIIPDDPGGFVARIAAFVELVRALGPSPLREGLTTQGQERDGCRRG